MKVKFGWLIFKFCSCMFQVVCSQCDRESQGSYPEVWGTDHHFWSAGSQVSQRTKYSADARYENPWNCIILHSCGSSLQWWKLWNYQLKVDENIHAAYFFLRRALWYYRMSRYLVYMKDMDTVHKLNSCSIQNISSVFMAKLLIIHLLQKWLKNKQS